MAKKKKITVKLKKLGYVPIKQIPGNKLHSYQNKPNTSYGYGWFVDQTPGMPTKIYHSGDNGGYQI